MSQDACKRISEGAKISKTKALVIGYEGLFSSSPINANLLSNYREALATGKKARRPIYAFGGSFLTRGPLTKVVEAYKNKVQVLVFGRTGKTGADSIPGKCATIWMQDKGEGTEGRKVIIVGHSFGGGAAWELANALRSKNVTVDAVVTADPRSPKQCMGECWSWAKPSNVSQWSNFYQTSFLSLRGHKVPGATNNFMSGYRHGSIQNAPGFYQAIANRIDGVSSPMTVAGPVYSTGNERPGSNGDLNPSTISGAPAPAASQVAAQPAGAPQAAATPINPATSGLLSAAVQNSPGRDDEEKRFQRASATENATGGSAVAKKVGGEPGIFTYFKPGGGRPPDDKSLTLNGASGTGRGLAAGPQHTPSSSGAGIAETATPNGAKPAATTSEMLNKLWPLSKIDSGMPVSGGGGFGMGNSNSSATAPLSALDNLSFDGKAGVSPNADLAATANPDQTSETTANQASTADQSQVAMTLFHRVHLKHENWFKRRDRF